MRSMSRTRQSRTPGRSLERACRVQNEIASAQQADRHFDSRLSPARAGPLEAARKITSTPAAIAVRWTAVRINRSYGLVGRLGSIGGAGQGQYGAGRGEPTG